jgi:hypothetical protein
LTARYAGSTQLIEIYEWIDAKICVQRQFVAIFPVNAGLDDQQDARHQKQPQHDFPERGLVEPPE